MISPLFRWPNSLCHYRGHELFPIEVFGMDTASYLARKAIKESYYNERYGKDGWASWVAPAGPLPHLPDKGCS
ncbi:TPA: hypothetical protein MIT43_25815 [Klebsiella pneumoniae]|nr:hypothetical protein [Klebsiella pneumoniae]